jgi:N-acylglucosamine 2-epimerase
MASFDKESISHWHGVIERELFQSVLPFWTQFSNDEEQGGFFACLDTDGALYDDRKFMWLNGRQV